MSRAVRMRSPGAQSLDAFVRHIGSNPRRTDFDAGVLTGIELALTADGTHARRVTPREAVAIGQRAHALGLGRPSND